VPAKTPTAREQLRDLRDVLAVRLRGPDEIDVERRRALAAVETARQAQRAFYAHVPPGEQPDPDGERAVCGVVLEAEQVADTPWDARKEGARLAIEQARADVAAYVRDHWDELAAELLPMSVAAQGRLAGALDETEQALHEWSEVAHEWGQIAPLAGIASSGLPTLDVAAVQAALPGEVPTPAPASLLGPALVGANNGNERSS